MTDLFTQIWPNKVEDEVNIPCKIVVLYHDSPSREQAMNVCSRMISKFWQDLPFEFSWWKFSFLADPVMAGLAAQAAASADIVLFSVSTPDELSSEVKACIELWLDQKPNPGGLLVALVGREGDVKETSNPAHDHLRRIAQRGKMEFVSRWESSALEGTAYVDMMMSRANQVSPILEEMLQRTQPPQHWGINE